MEPLSFVLEGRVLVALSAYYSLGKFLFTFSQNPCEVCSEVQRGRLASKWLTGVLCPHQADKHQNFFLSPALSQMDVDIYFKNAYCGGTFLAVQ